MKDSSKTKAQLIEELAELRKKLSEFEVPDFAIGRTIKSKIEDDDQYKLLISNIPYVTWISDASGNTSFMSPNIEEVYGFTPEEIYAGGQELWFDRVHPDDKERLLNEWQAFFEKDIPYSIEYRIKRKDGEWIWLSDMAIEKRKMKGVMVAYGIFHDITERKRVEEALNESELKFRTLYEGSSDAVMLLDEKAFTECNDALLEVFGCSSKDQFIGKHPADFSPEFQPGGITSLELAGERIATAYREGRNRFEWVHTKLDGTEFDAEVWLTVLEIKGKKVLQAVVRDITDRKRAETALRESEKRFHALSMATFEGIIFTEDGIIIDCNEQLAEMVGYSLDELIGVESFKMIHPDDRERVRQNVFSGSEEPYELRFVCKDGSIRNAEVHPQMMTVKGEKLRVTAIRDITDSKLAREALKKSEAGLKKAQEVAHLGNWELDLVKNNLYWSDEIYRIFGIDPEKFGATYEVFLGCVHPDDRDLVTKAYTDSVENRTKYDIEHRLLMPDGSVKYIEERCQTDYADDGTPIRSTGTVLDITKRKKAEEALAESEERFTLAMKGANDGLWDWNLQTNEVYFSLRWKSMLGYGDDELENAFETWEGLVHPEDIEQAKRHIENYLGGKEPSLEVEFRMRHKDGHWLDILSRGYAVRSGADEKPLRFVGTHIDITERKRAEEAVLEERNRAQSYFETVESIIVALDTNGCITSINRKGCEVLGRTESELNGKNWFKTCLPRTENTQKEVFNIFKKIISGAIEGSEYYENYIQTSSGEKRLIAWHNSYLRDKDKEITGTLSSGEDITERKQAEVALRNSEATLRSMLNATSDSFILFNSTGNILAINQVGAKRLGKRPEELQGTNIFDLLPPDIAKARKKRGDEAIRTGKPVTFEDQRGAYFFHNTVFPIFNEKGVVDRFVISAQDITERRQAEEELRRSEANFRTIFESANDAFLIHDPITFKVLDVNRKMCEVFGYTKEEAIGLDMVDLIEEAPPYDLDNATKFGRKAQKGEPQLFEFKLKKKSGESFWGEVSLKKISLGGEERLLAVDRDITKRKQAEEALKLTQFTVEHRSEVTAWVTPDASIIYANEAASRLLGYSHEEILQLKAYGVDMNLSKETWPEFWQKLKDPGHMRYETELGGKDGTTYPVEIVSNYFEYKGKEIAIIDARDITERKRAEKEKGTLLAQLRNQQKLESIGTLAGGVAHEINNPINGIMNYAQIIDDRLDPKSPLREFTDAIGKETERVATIVRNLLNFASQEQESHSPANMTDIVNDTLSLIRTIIIKDQIVLEVKMADDLPKFKCRSQQIQQVLMNLLTNGRDALNERYPEYDPDKIMTVTVRLIEKEGRSWIHVTVEDHGAGIPDEISERIFDPFFTTKDRTKGTGLGLAISHGIVQDHHGKLRMESEPGKYTRFYLELPVDNGWKIE